MVYSGTVAVQGVCDKALSLWQSGRLCVRVLCNAHELLIRIKSVALKLTAPPIPNPMQSALLPRFLI